MQWIFLGWQDNNEDNARANWEKYARAVKRAITSTSNVPNSALSSSAHCHLPLFLLKGNLLLYHRSTKTMSFLVPRVTRYSLRSAHQLFDPARSSPAVCWVVGTSSPSRASPLLSECRGENSLRDREVLEVSRDEEWRRVRGECELADSLWRGLGGE